MDRSDNEILRRKFGDDMPSVTDISTKLSLMLVNTHYSLSGPRALSPKVIEVGGVHIKEPKALDEVSVCFNTHSVALYNERLSSKIITFCGDD